MATLHVTNDRVRQQRIIAVADFSEWLVDARVANLQAFHHLAHHFHHQLVAIHQNDRTLLGTGIFQQHTHHLAQQRFEMNFFRQQLVGFQQRLQIKQLGLFRHLAMTAGTLRGGLFFLADAEGDGGPLALQRQAFHLGAPRLVVVIGVTNKAGGQLFLFARNPEARIQLIGQGFTHAEAGLLGGLNRLSVQLHRLLQLAINPRQLGTQQHVFVLEVVAATLRPDFEFISQGTRLLQR